MPLEFQSWLDCSAVNSPAAAFFRVPCSKTTPTPRLSSSLAINYPVPALLTPPGAFKVIWSVMGLGLSNGAKTVWLALGNTRSSFPPPAWSISLTSELLRVLNTLFSPNNKRLPPVFKKSKYCLLWGSERAVLLSTRRSQICSYWSRSWGIPSEIVVS
jgi:hypothetical protein